MFFILGEYVFTSPDNSLIETENLSYRPEITNEIWNGFMTTVAYNPADQVWDDFLQEVIDEFQDPFWQSFPHLSANASIEEVDIGAGSQDIYSDRIPADT